MLEPQRTNSFQQSNQFDTTWAISIGVTITSEQTISPQGTNNGWKFEKTAAAYKSIGQSYTSSTETTFSIFAKKGTLNIITLFANISGGSNLYQRFDLENGIVSTGSGMSSSNIKDYGNGWYRCSSTFTNTNVIDLAYFPDFGETEAGYIYIYGAQTEQGSYATSYIPTSGQSGGVTRVGDACNNENLNVDYSGDYTLYLEHETLSITEYNQFQFRQETSISYIFRVGNSINVGSGLYSATNTIGFNKFALSVGSDGSYSFYKNGSLLSSGSGLNANLETLKGDAAGMSIKDIKLYNTRLSNAELQALTTI